LPHKRSPESRKKRALMRELRRHALLYSFRDAQRAESICLLSQRDLLSLASSSSSGSAVQLSDVPDVVRGEVLVDSRGQGSFQRA
jgi:hypothetical protein